MDFSDRKGYYVDLRESLKAGLKARFVEAGVPYGTCCCGCGAETPIAKQSYKSRGLVAGEPTPYLPGGHSRRKSGQEYTVEDRGHTSLCWIWQLCQVPFGYGRKAIGPGKTTSAHVWHYEQQYGPVPDGLELDHLCCNPSCVNPDHLEPVTHATNCQRSISVKLDWDKVRAIRVSAAGPTELALRYGVTKATIHQVRRGETWREVA